MEFAVYESSLNVGQLMKFWLQQITTHLIRCNILLCQHVYASGSTPFLFYKNSFYENQEAENRPKIKNFVRITPGSRSRDL